MGGERWEGVFPMISNDERTSFGGFPKTPSMGRVLWDSVVVPVAAGQTVAAGDYQDEVFIIHASREEAANFALQGNDLVIEFANGSRLTIRDFFVGSVEGRVIFIDDDLPYWADFSRVFHGLGDLAKEPSQWFVPVERDDYAPLILRSAFFNPAALMCLDGSWSRHQADG
jgi:hypothetical protein